jgi:hypothetical protein
VTTGRAAVGRTVAVIGLLSAATLGAAISAAGETSPSPSPSTPALPVAVSLRAIGPLGVQPGQTLRVSGQLRNGGGDAISFLDARLLVSPSRVGSRNEFSTYAADPAGPPPSDAASVATATLAHSTLAPGAAEAFHIEVPVDDLHLPETSWQVYELAVVVEGTSPLGTTTVGQLRTFLPWAPLGVPGVGVPTRVAWLWPLDDEPHRTTDTTWRDDSLAGELGSEGRLSTLLAAGAAAQSQHPSVKHPTAPRQRVKTGKHRRAKPPPPPPPPRPTTRPVPITWAVDPLLVQDVTSMAAGYQVGGGDLGSRHGGAGQAAARDWLSRLRSAVPADATIALPYADPDVVAAVHSGLADEIQLATTTGGKILTRLLGAPPLDYAWPPGGVLDQRTLDTLFAAGTTTAVLDDDALPVTGGNGNETPSAHATVKARDGRLDALLADGALTQAVDAGALDPASGPLTVQRVLSELLMIQAERPSDQRTIVIAPDRRWDPTAGYAHGLLAGSGRAPWVEPVTLPQALSTPADPAVTRGPLTYPTDARQLEISHTYLHDVNTLQDEADAFAAIVPPGNPQAQSFDEGVLRLLSSAWRTDPDGATQTIRSFRGGLRATMGKVRIASQGLVTLTSHSGTIPVTVSNELDTPVRLIIAVSSQHLEVGSGGQVTRVIPPHRQVPVDIHATARTTGIFQLNVSLFTPGEPRQRYGKAVVLTVRSTAYGAVALFITGGATAVLFIGAAVRLVRRARAGRRQARAAT